MLALVKCRIYCRQPLLHSAQEGIFLIARASAMESDSLEISANVSGRRLQVSYDSVYGLNELAGCKAELEGLEFNDTACRCAARRAQCSRLRLGNNCPDLPALSRFKLSYT
jgi:hypothetical protein